jgi:transposase
VTVATPDWITPDDIMPNETVIHVPQIEDEATAPASVSDILCEVIESLLPLHKPKPKGGRTRPSDRACLNGMFVLRSGIPWEMLPRELGCGSGMTCWRRLRDWQQVGIWDLIHFGLLAWLARYSNIDRSRAVVDSYSVRAVLGGPQTGPKPTDRAKRH